MNRSLIISVLSFLLFIIFQVMLFKRIVLFNTAFCFVYVAFILLLPVDTNPLSLMLIGFALGLITDVFYDHQGMHAAATVAVAYARNYWLASIRPQGGYDPGSAPTVSAQGLIWFLTYITPLLLLHHLILFFIDAGGFGLTGLTLGKTLASLLFTLYTLILHQYFFYKRTR